MFTKEDNLKTDILGLKKIGGNRTHLREKHKTVKFCKFSPQR